jgi:predicted O-methyltransferase YrrM
VTPAYPDGRTRLLPRSVEKIPGWMWGFELDWMYTLAQNLTCPPYPILNVGCFRGRSCAALAQAGPVTCVDLYEEGDVDTFERHQEALRSVGRYSDAHRGRSQDILADFFVEGRKFRLAFIDGSHEYDDVREDLRLARWLVPPGGAIVCDDYLGYPGVARAVDEFGGFVPVVAMGEGVRPEVLRSKMAWRIVT